MSTPWFEICSGNENIYASIVTLQDLISLWPDQFVAKLYGRYVTSNDSRRSFTLGEEPSRQMRALSAKSDGQGAIKNAQSPEASDLNGRAPTPR
jgi:hypothetical protein